jgi:hypothetical protein
MSTSTPLDHQVNRLYIEMYNVMAQIRVAESGARLEREQFLALIAKKAAVVTEAKTIISQVSQTLDLASSDPNERVPHSQYLVLKHARTMARTIVKMAHTPASRDTQIQAESKSDWLDESTDDEYLPF